MNKEEIKDLEQERKELYRRIKIYRSEREMIRSKQNSCQIRIWKIQELIKKERDSTKLKQKN